MSSLSPHFSSRVDQYMKFMFTRKGDPAFVVPFSEYVRVGLDGLDGALSLINDRQFVTISPVPWTLDLGHQLHEKDGDKGDRHLIAGTSLRGFRPRFARVRTRGLPSRFGLPSIPG